jgi:hypothetical protein
MDKIKVLVGRVEYLQDGRESSDQTRAVEFAGELLAKLQLFGSHKGRPTDTRGTDQALYGAEDGRLVVHVRDWSNWQGEPTEYALLDVTAEDLGPMGDYAELGEAAGMGRALTLDEATGRAGGEAQPDQGGGAGLASGIRVGYVRLDRPGDVDPSEMNCMECWQGCEGGAWIVLIVDEGYRLQALGPVCDRCAQVTG